VSRDSTFFNEKAENPWWINIDIPRLSGRIYISYKDVRKGNFDSLVNDGFKMAFKQHTDVATEIRDSVIKTPNGIEGIYFSLGGNTATANQFFLTDSTRHFLRGALYFDSAPNEDSLGIVNDFLKKDVQHLINTLKWKN
jgi:gliding motility-associated lipoprotein GldD